MRKSINYWAIQSVWSSFYHPLWPVPRSKVPILRIQNLLWILQVTIKHLDVNLPTSNRVYYPALNYTYIRVLVNRFYISIFILMAHNYILCIVMCDISILLFSNSKISSPLITTLRVRLEPAQSAWYSRVFTSHVPMLISPRRFKIINSNNDSTYYLNIYILYV